MTSAPTLTGFDVRLRGLMTKFANHRELPTALAAFPFEPLAAELFALQYTLNAPYRRFCEARGVSPSSNIRWDQIPAIPTSGFKEWELSCIPPLDRTHVFHSSGTTHQSPSRHYHHATSLELYATSLTGWFESHLLPDLQFGSEDLRAIILTPPPSAVPHSSLVFMFDNIGQKLGWAPSAFQGRLLADGSWGLDLPATVEALDHLCVARQPAIILGTAFSFVHLLDHLAAESRRFELPPGSRALETGGYKGRSRSLSKLDLHAFIEQSLGIPTHKMVCEYGMSELGSQAYDSTISQILPPAPRVFQFPPWSRTRIISPETSTEVAEGETGLVQIFDLANAYSVMALLTEDLAIRRGTGFELIGRAALAEPRGCSLQAA